MQRRRRFSVSLRREERVQFYSTVVLQGSEVAGRVRRAQLLREPENPVDRDAVRVVAEGKQIGYIRAGHAAILAPLLDEGMLSRCTCTLKPGTNLIHIDCSLRCTTSPSSQRLVDRLRQLAHTNHSHDEEYDHVLVSSMNKCLCFTMSVCRSILDAETVLCVDRFQAASHDAQRLYCRLLRRKHAWIRLDSITAPEVSNVREAVHELVRAALCLGPQSIWMADSLSRDYIAGLPLASLKQLAKQCCPGLKTSRPKTELAHNLCSHLLTPNPITSKRPCEAKAIKDAMAKICCQDVVCVDPASRSAFELLHRIFSCNFTDPVVQVPIQEHHARSMHYVPYSTNAELTVDKESFCSFNLHSASCRNAEALFESKRYQACYDLGRGFRDVLLTRVLEHTSDTMLFDDRTPLIRICYLSAKALQKLKQYEQACSWFRFLIEFVPIPLRQSRWFDKLALILEQHLGDAAGALLVCSQGLRYAAGTNRVRSGVRHSLAHRYKRLLRKLDLNDEEALLLQTDVKIHEPEEVVLYRRPINCETGKKSRFWGEDNTELNIEAVVLEHYLSTETVGSFSHGLHAEGRILRTLFGVLLWDELWDDSVANAFFTPYQDAPMDLAMPNEVFYSRREASIEARLLFLRSCDIESVVKRRIESTYGLVCRSVAWRHAEELPFIAACFPRDALITLLRLLAKEYRYWSSGMPDLLLWDTSAKRLRYVEVKGPRDRLSDQQKAWIRKLVDVGVEVEVCKIKEP